MATFPIVIFIPFSAGGIVWLQISRIQFTLIWTNHQNSAVLPPQNIVFHLICLFKHKVKFHYIWKSIFLWKHNISVWESDFIPRHVWTCDEFDCGVSVPDTWRKDRKNEKLHKYMYIHILLLEHIMYNSAERASMHIFMRLTVGQCGDLSAWGKKLSWNLVVLANRAL